MFCRSRDLPWQVCTEDLCGGALLETAGEEGWLAAVTAGAAVTSACLGAPDCDAKAAVAPGAPRDLEGKVRWCQRSTLGCTARGFTMRSPRYCE